MVLKPLEFSDCLADSPWFQQNLHEHEQALEDARKSIKTVETQFIELVDCIKKLSAAQRAFAKSLCDLKIETVGSTQTDDERAIANCLKDFGRRIKEVEDHRSKLIQDAESCYIPLKKFRLEKIGKVVNDEKKKYEKESQRFYASLEKYLHLSTVRKNDFREADAQLGLQQRNFGDASLQYVAEIQSVQERMKFELVETLGNFLYSWLTFYHVEGIGRDVLPRNWTKYYCVYQKETRIFTMIPVNSTVKTDMKGALEQSVSFKLKSCIRRASDSIDKRFCFDLVSDERDTMTFQALSEEDRRQWLDAMDGKEPVYSPGTGPHNQGGFETVLDEVGFDFVRECLKAIESRGISEQGLYRNCGVTSKVQKLMQIALDKKKFNSSSTKNQLNLCSEDSEWEIKTISSAVKTFLRNLPEPLMTFELHSHFINAAKMDDSDQRVDHIHFYVYKLPESHRNMLKIVISHLRKVADKAEENLMTVGNLGVCFGPTLLRPKEETVTAIMDIKFCNVVVEVLIANYEKVFNTKPPISLGTPCPPKPVHNMVQIMPPATSDPSSLLQQSGKSVIKSTGRQGPYQQSPNGSQQLSVYDNTSNRQFESQSAEDLTANVTLSTNIVKLPASQQVSPAGNSTGRLFNLRRPKQATQGISGTSLTSNASVDIIQNISNCSLNDKSHTSSDSLNSTSSERSTGLQTMSQKASPLANSTNVGGGLTKSKMTASYAPHYNPQASETLSHRLKKRHSGGNLSSIITPNVIHTTIYPSSSLTQPYYNTLSSTPYSNRNLQSTPLPGLKNSSLSNSSSIPNNVGNSFNNGYTTNESTYPYFNSLINPNAQIQPSRRVRTLYECTAGHETELSFSPGQIITNVYESKEEGWLVGTLNGKTGLIPSNYCEPLP
uniref:Rho GTPase-activating protein 26 n=1 Tax=Parastrongyloides trichosuri TaxID=131310 RepID=A0A0N4Z2K5_PARTI